MLSAIVERVTVYRADQAKAVSGTGIGLPICERLVEAPVVRLWVDGEQGKGSTFRFTLPQDDTGDTTT